MSLYRTPFEFEYEYRHAPATRNATPRPQLERRQRITLRLPRSLKGGVEASAALDGVSVESWVARALARSIDPRVRA